MSGLALAVGLRDRELLAALSKPAAWWRRLMAQRSRRRQRVLARAAALPMRLHHLRDLGIVEADARRLGLLA